MVTRRSSFSVCSALLLILASVGRGTAQTRMVDPGTGSAGDRVEITEQSDGAGNWYEVETHTDPYGRRSRITRPIPPRATASRTASPIAAGSVDPAATGVLPGAPAWRELGLDGGDVHTIAVSPLDPQLVLTGLSSEDTFISPRSGIYRSADGGSTWNPAALLEGGVPISVAVNLIRFAPDGTAFAASALGIWKSSDGGATWRRLSGDSFRPDAWVVAIEPGDPRHLWIGLAYGGGIMRSLDGGATWNVVPVPGLLAAANCRGIAFDPARPGRVYACFGTYTEGQLWVSGNGGAAWINRSGGLPVSPFNDVEFDGTRVLVGAGGNYSGGGLYASTSDGASWTNLSSSWRAPRISNRVVRDIELDPASPCVIWIAAPQGIFRSADCGVTWVFSVGRATQDTRCVEVAPGAVVFGGIETFAVMRREGTGNFEPSARGIRELHVYSVASNPLDSRELAASFSALNSGGIYASRDGGESWQLEPTVRSRVPLVLFDPLGQLYAVSDGPSTLGPEGLYRREADGAWTSLGPDQGPLFETGFHWVQISPHDPQFILGGGADYSDHGFALGIWRSTDGGATWSKVDRRETNVYYAYAGGVLVDDGSDRVALAAVPIGPASLVLRSEDRGATWSLSMAGLPSTIIPNAIASSPRDPNMAYLGSALQNAIYRSADQGRSWHATSYPGTLTPLISDPADARVLYGLSYISEPHGRLMRSRDAGESFEGFWSGLTPPPYGLGLSFGSGACPSLLVATTSGVLTRELDSTPPRLEVQMNPDVLWPPNHKLVDIHATVTISDACDPAPTFVLTSINCSEAGAEADIVGAALGQPDTDFQLRATRLGTGPGRTYSIRYTATDADGNVSQVVRTVEVPHDQRVASRAAGIPAQSGDFVPLETRLQPVRPSPFRSTTSIAFEMAAAASASVRVFDLRGASVRTLLDGFRPAGRHRLEWDGRDDSGTALPGGVYWIRFETPDHRQTQPVVRLR